MTTDFYKTSCLLLSLAISNVRAALPTASLSDCQSFAATFDNTCTDGTELSDLASHAGEDVECTGTMRCPGGSGSSTYTSGSPCTWTRKLCVTCTESGSVVKIKVQANNLPNHCVNATVNNPVGDEQEWDVVWQPDVTNIMNYQASDFDTVTKTSNLMCDLINITASSNMNAASDYSIESRRRRRLQPPPCPGTGESPEPGFDCEGNDVTGNNDSGDSSSGGAGEALSTAAGMALSGGYIYNGLAGGDTDAVENEGDSLDVCTSHATPDG